MGVIIDNMVENKGEKTYFKGFVYSVEIAVDQGFPT